MKAFSAAVLCLVLCAVSADAHVPFIERQDYSFDEPFVVGGSPEKSIAVYSWLQSGNDTDVFRINVTGSVRLYGTVIVPVCPEYSRFLPSMAVAGPGLPQPEVPLPFDLPEGCGAVVVNNTTPGLEREQFYEPFSGKSYYRSPEFDQTVSETGSWYVYVWDPYRAGGDYVAVVGFKERFSLFDIFRALFNTTLIRFGRELHTGCAD